MNVIHIIIYFPHLIAKATQVGNLTSKKGQIKLFKSGVAFKICLRCVFAFKTYCIASHGRKMWLPYPGRWEEYVRRVWVIVGRKAARRRRGQSAKYWWPGSGKKSYSSSSSICKCDTMSCKLHSFCTLFMTYGVPQMDHVMAARKAARWNKPLFTYHVFHL